MTELRDARPGGAMPPDLDAVLTPLGGADGCGEELPAWDPAIAEIMDARREDDNLPQGVWQSERKVADWNVVVVLCHKVLAERSKDLRVAVWMVEALVHRDGFAGLAPGLEMIEALCRRFWDGLHPLPDEDGDLSGRANAVALLNAHLPSALRVLPLVRSRQGQGEVVALSWNDYVIARMHNASGAARAASDGLTMAAFETAVSATPAAQLGTLLAQVTAGRDVLLRLVPLLEELCRRDAPSLHNLRRLLEELVNWLTVVTPRLPEPAFPVAEPDVSPMTTTQDSPAPVSAPGAISSRDDAYRRLAEIADYLMRTEPHSPTPYVLRRVQGWGRMPLNQLLLDMAQGRNDLAAILELIMPSDGV